MTKSELDKAGNTKVMTSDYQDVIDELFAALRLAFPHYFERHYSDTQILGSTKQLWYGYLKNVPISSIREAMVTSIGEHKFPPSVSEFLDRCIEASQPMYQLANDADDSLPKINYQQSLKRLLKLRKELQI